MNISSNKIFFISIAVLLLCGLFSFSKIVFAQTDFTSSSEPVQNYSEPASSSPVYSPNELMPETTIASPSNVSGGTILGNLRIFGQAIGMSYVDPRTILARIIRLAMSFVGIIVLVIILWSGLSFMFAGGDEEKSQQAKKTFINMLIGLFIILSAYSIVTFIFGALNNSAGTSDVIQTETVSPNSVEPVVRDPVVNP